MTANSTPAARFPLQMNFEGFYSCQGNVRIIACDAYITHTRYKQDRAKERI